MKILVIPASFKSTIKSIHATNIIADAVQKVLTTASIDKIIVADGGEGTIEAFDTHFGSTIVNKSIMGPLGKAVSAKVGFLDPLTAVIESSQAIGFSLLKSTELNPFLASSYGVGELINYVVEKGAKKVLVTMGDSSTMDMGVGMLNALGVRFFTASGETITPTLSNLHKIVDLDDTKLQFLRQHVEFLGLVDTNDFLCGEVGQVQLYGKQKGLRDSDITIVESSYFQFSDIIKRHFSIDVTQIPGATGSGGLAAALHSFLNARLINTLDYFSERIDIDRRIHDADVVITGEGCLDNQTKYGKIPFYVASRCMNKCIGIFGRYTEEGFLDMAQVCKDFSAFTMNPVVAEQDSDMALRRATIAISQLLH